MRSRFRRTRMLFLNTNPPVFLQGHPMSDRIFNILFLCTHNSARSILAEAILNKLGGGRFCGFSAGSQPKDAPNPLALSLLGRMNHEVAGLTSKTWDVFVAPGAPVMDFIFTVCDDAAGESCPVWPGHPASAHWGIADPSRNTGTDSEKALAFAEAYRLLERRISIFVALPFASLDALTLQTKLREIGRSEGATDHAASINGQGTGH
jgi:arsenate reductase (thioredoxin)